MFPNTPLFWIASYLGKLSVSSIIKYLTIKVNYLFRIVMFWSSCFLFSVQHINSLLLPSSCWKAIILTFVVITRVVSVASIDLWNSWKNIKQSEQGKGKSLRNVWLGLGLQFFEKRFSVKNYFKYSCFWRSLVELCFLYIQNEQEDILSKRRHHDQKT